MQKFSTPATGASPSSSPRSAGKARADEKAGKAFFNSSGGGEGSSSTGDDIASNSNSGGIGAYGDRKPRDRSLSAVRGGYQVCASCSWSNCVHEAWSYEVWVARVLFMSGSLKELCSSRNDNGKS